MLNNNSYFRNNNLNKKLKIIFLTIILSFSVITNIFSAGLSSSSNFAFLKDVDAVKSKEYVLEYDKKAQEKNNYYKGLNFDNNKYSSLSESDSFSTSLDLDMRNNYYYDDNNNNKQYKQITANIEKEVIKCNNLNVNLNEKSGSSINRNNNNENNDNIIGQIFSNQKNKEAAISSSNNNQPSFSSYEYKDHRLAVICNNLNDNDLKLKQPTHYSPDPKETLTVIKNIECQADPETCEQISIQSSDFTIVIEGNNPSQNNFPGSSTGTDIELEPGPYSVTEERLDPVIPEICNTMGYDAGKEASELGENLFLCTNFSAECEGHVTIGNPQICYIKNVIVQQNVFGDHIYVTWWAYGDTRPTDVFFTSSNDTGKTFSTPINLSNNAGDSAYQQIRADGSNVYITWFDNTEGFFKIFFTSSNDNSKTFSTLVNLSTTDTVGSEYPQIAITPLIIDDQ